MIKRTIITLFFMLGLGTLAISQQMSEQDRKFIEKTVVDNMVEVELGRLASEQADNPKVQEFGHHMVQAHTQIREKLKTIAEEKGIRLPEQLDQRHQQIVRRLSQLSGRQFAREYMREMVEIHQKEIDLFERYAEKGRAPEVRQFAFQSIPTLIDHLEMAKELNRQIIAQK